MFFIRLYLWIAPNVLLLLALAGILRHQRQTEHPLFVSYLILQLGYFSAAFSVDWMGARHLTSRSTYLWIFIIGLVLSAVLEISVLYELAHALIFSPVKRVSQLRRFLQWTLGILSLLGIGLAATLAWSSKERLINIAQTLNVVASVIALGLLVALILLTVVLNVPWRSLQAGIALGFGISAAAELAGSGVLSQLGGSKSGYIAADLVRMSGFHVCALIWFLYVLLPEPQPRENASALTAGDLDGSVHALRRIVEGQ